MLEGQIRFNEAVGVDVHSVQTLIETIEGLSSLVNEVEVAFGLKATGEGVNLVASQVGVRDNDIIKCTWRWETRTG